MTKADKLLQRFFSNPPPKNFKWEDFVVMMQRLGFKLEFNGRGSSHCIFYKDDPHVVLDFLKPHPGNELKVVYVKKARAFLEEHGIGVNL
ncbi:type II toxin-antitoxin system HicA family toxin [Acinetobacter baumannii]|uniref:type II toxin-antitoxin system HicA family toxin n=1 Tax=Acinetobacter baumannii TaxID=470 RepID=UPI0027425813|nr:type II toxin-antitoxin system HicA family toxin [Acinetobacter baumannii]MDP7807717.1 type II toxin-antitoxin system HicA family toxin [Acinetobacter baumannii]MDP7861858.1 type II toxin-antitoxin system HicA family toxin [Acinetobacter baumannii]MDP7880352.1 type II toxin-antitoxin system HicA family toxin [Acinetobacter baumannii]